MTQWLPMETAPRENEELILLKTNQGIISAWFNPPVIVHDYFNGDEQEGCEWVCYDDAVQIEVEWVGHNQYNDSGVLGWMPIPQ